VLSVIRAVIYWVIRGFGPAAQAGFGVGGRVMQGLFLPVMALAFAVTPVAGQNFGARRYERVRETFRQATALSSALMLALTLLCQWRSEWFIEVFTRQPDAVEVGATYLRVIAWNFLATGLIFSCSGMFQALGNTWPSLASSGARLLTFVLPAASARPGQGPRTPSAGARCAVRRRSRSPRRGSAARTRRSSSRCRRGCRWP